ncbi:MAG: four helix bundle protein [Acidobacteriota bacterium]|nr:four helix bundle protein [Acidobacteriota bacterium]
MSEEKKPRGYKDLLVWQKGMELAREIYTLTQTFPTEERYGLISQMRRAGVSIPSNIAEGQARHTTQEFIQFVSHAEGSVAELETQLILAQDLRCCMSVSPDRAYALLSELRKMLNSLRRRLDGSKA